MCVTNIYIDRYPNGREVEFRQTSLCQYGLPGRPCQSVTTLENPVRKIQYGELSTEYILTQPAFTQTPPRSPGGSNHRYSGGDTGSEDGQRRRRSRRMSFAVDVGLGKKLPTKQHRKERIVIVDSPPTPQTPPQAFRQTFTAPSSPNPPFIIDGSPRGPIIVDERPLRNRNRSSSSANAAATATTTVNNHTPSTPATASANLPRSSSVEAVLGERFPLRRSRSRPEFESPSSSHTSFDSRARREAEEEEHRREQRRQDEEEAARRRAERIAAQDEEIRRRPAIPPKPLRQREFLRPVVSQSTVGNVVDDRRLQERLEAAAAERRRLEEKEREKEREKKEKEKEKEERERFIRLGMEADQEEAQRRRLRERQLPGRRFSVGPGHRRHRILYDDGVYRWE